MYSLNLVIHVNFAKVSEGSGICLSHKGDTTMENSFEVKINEIYTANVPLHHDMTNVRLTPVSIVFH